MKPNLILFFLAISSVWFGVACENGASNPNGASDYSSTALDDYINEDSDNPDSEDGEAVTVGIFEDYDNTNRVIWQKPNLVFELLGDLTDKTIADIGAGTGFFALRAVPKAKKVIALDIDPRFKEYLDSIKVLELPENVQDRLETRLAREDDPRLQNDEADVVIIVNTFMYIQDRVPYLRNLKRGIAEGGRLLIIDFKKKRTPIGPPSDIRIPLFQAEEELHKAGYTNIRTNDTALDHQYLILAER